MTVICASLTPPTQNRVSWINLAAHGMVQSSFKYFQAQGFHIPFSNLVPVFNLFYTENFFLLVCNYNLLCCNTYQLFFTQSLWPSEKGLALSSVSSHQLKTTSLFSLPFLRPNQHSSFSLPLYILRTTATVLHAKAIQTKFRSVSFGLCFPFNYKTDFFFSSGIIPAKKFDF